MRAQILSVALALLSLSACVTTTPTPEPAAQENLVAAEATVTRDGESWTLDYHFADDAPVWAFIRSPRLSETREPWRPGQWRVETPGVILDRIGEYDVLRAIDGGLVPRHIRLSFTPRHEHLEAGYTPLVFSDGSVALPSVAFDLFPLPSLAAAEAMPADLNEYDGEIPDTRVTWRDANGQVLFRGERVDSATEVDGRTFVLFGQAQVTETPRLVTVRDPEAPEWIAETLSDFAPRVADYYGQRLGAPGNGERPMIMVSWSGPIPGVSSMGGSVLPNLIVMTFGGEGMVNETPQIVEQTHWFIGHEQAHFWLGQTVRYAVARDTWITEGGANLMAVRALRSMSPEYDDRAALQTEVDDCARLAVLPVAEAGRRGDHRAYYACGAVFALVAEGAQRQASGGDWFDFLRVLIDANREDGDVTRVEWLDAVTAVAGDETLAMGIATLLDHGSETPHAAIAALFTRAGVPYRMEDGQVVLD